MTALTIRDHLITARDDLGWTYPYTAVVAFNETYVTAHASGPLSCEPARTAGVLLEDLPEKFTFGLCAECAGSAAATDHSDLQDSLEDLRSLTHELAKIQTLLDEFTEGNSVRPGAETRRHTNRICELYYAAGRYFRPNPQHQGRSHAQVDAALDQDIPVSAQVRALWDHMEDLAEDGTRQWVRMAALQPLRVAETTRVAPSGQPRVRAVVRDDTQRFGAIPSDPFGDNVDRALVVEAPRLLVLDAWELIDWDSRLPDDGHSVADPTGATPAELELALTLYGQTTAVAAPSLQELLDGVRHASS